MKDLPPSKSDLRHFYFPGASSTGGREGILVKVSPQGAAPWLGTFAFGHESPQTLTGIFSCPNANQICVVSSGSGFLVDATNPVNFIQVKSCPIVDVRAALSRQLLVFVDFTSISAYDSKGLAWRTKDLSWDGLTITLLTSESIEGLAWDAPLDRQVKVTINLSNGAFVGGSSPSLDMSDDYGARQVHQCRRTASSKPMIDACDAGSLIQL